MERRKQASEGPHLRRRAHPPAPARCSTRSADPPPVPGSRALRRRAGRQIPGHGPPAVGHHAPRLRRGWCDPRAHRRPEAGHLRLPRRRRPRVSRHARCGAVEEWTLDVNWRSDEGLLEAYAALFADAQLGSTRASPTARSVRQIPTGSPRLLGPPVPEPLCGSASCTHEAGSCRSPPRGHAGEPKAPEGAEPDRP